MLEATKWQPTIAASDRMQAIADLGADAEPHWLDPELLEPIHTAPGDLDDAKRSTESGMGFVLALAAIAVVGAVAGVAALWPADHPQPKAVAGVAR